MEPSVAVPTIPGASFRLPPQLEGLRRLAYNLYWSWHPRAKILFSRIDAAASKLTTQSKWVNGTFFYPAFDVPAAARCGKNCSGMRIDRDYCAVRRMVSLK